MRPNVLLVVLDAARRDALEPYGALPGSTPAIAQLAARGAALPEVYATGCWTIPSHASMFTGLLPRAAGLSRVPAPSASKPVLESQRKRLLPEVMRRAGYATGALSANLWISETSGFDAGFDDFTSVDSGRDVRFHGRAWTARLRWLMEGTLGRVDDGAAAAEATLEQWAAEPLRRPFFWFVNLIECHSPYLPPRPYGDVSLRDRLRATGDAQRYFNLDAIWRACVGGFAVPEETMDVMRRLYRGAIRSMDDWLSRLLERLDAARVLDDTLVIVFSDHGENFGEGGLLAHALSLDNRLIHVPFVAAGPGAQGADINCLASLPALVAESVGLEEHPWHDMPPAGVGVAQFDPPTDPGDPRAAEAAKRWGLGDEAVRRLTTPLTCAVAGNLKLVQNGDREEVYDLTSDPLELAPLLPANLDPARNDELEALRDVLRHPAVTSQRSEESSTEAAGAPSPEELRDIEERMKLLGYM
jgi:arylsulfatase A-like enzyme